MHANYTNMILADTGCAPEDASKIEHIMREDIFHGTLDWQSRAQFRGGAREAGRLLAANRSVYQEYFAVIRAAFDKMKRAGTETQNTVGHDI